MLPSHRNKSIDLLCKSIDWFLYEGNIGCQWFPFIPIDVVRTPANRMESFATLVNGF